MYLFSNISAHIESLAKIKNHMCLPIFTFQPKISINNKLAIRIKKDNYTID